MSPRRYPHPLAGARLVLAAVPVLLLVCASATLTAGTALHLTADRVPATVAAVAADTCDVGRYVPDRPCWRATAVQLPDGGPARSVHGGPVALQDDDPTGARLLGSTVDVTAPAVGDPATAFALQVAATLTALLLVVTGLSVRALVLRLPAVQVRQRAHRRRQGQRRRLATLAARRSEPRRAEMGR